MTGKGQHLPVKIFDIDPDFVDHGNLKVVSDRVCVCVSVCNLQLLKCGSQIPFEAAVISGCTCKTTDKRGAQRASNVLNCGCSRRGKLVLIERGTDVNFPSFPTEER